jgi:hypothetical protein
VSDFQKPSQTDMIAAFKRLLDAQAIAHASRDAEGFEAATDDLGHFLRMLNAGRIGEWFASRENDLTR